MVFIIITGILFMIFIACCISLDYEDLAGGATPILLGLFLITSIVCIAKEGAHRNKISIKEDEITRIEILDDDQILINKDVFNLSYLTIIISDKNIIRHTKKEREEPKKWFIFAISSNITEVFVPLDKLPNSEFEIKGNLQKKGEDN